MTTKAELLKAIREKCLDCCLGQPGEVRQCPKCDCPLHPFKSGKDPTPSRKSNFPRNVPSGTRLSKTSSPKKSPLAEEGFSSAHGIAEAMVPRVEADEDA